MSSTSTSRKPTRTEKITIPAAGGKVVISSTKKVSSTSRKPTKNDRPKLSPASGGRVMNEGGGNRYTEIYNVLNEALVPVDWETLNISGLLFIRSLIFFKD